LNFKKYKKLLKKGWIGFDEMKDIREIIVLSDWFNITIDGDRRKIILTKIKFFP